MIIDEYLDYLNENKLYIPENPLAKKFRKENGYLWLYHKTPIRNYNSIKKYGLRTKYHATTHGEEERKHKSGKKSISYSSNKQHSMEFVGYAPGAPEFDKESREEPLLVKVPNDGLELLFNSKYYDEYESIKNISPKDIIFPSDQSYKKIEQECKYLNTKKVIYPNLELDV